jgi:DNA-binding MarR family transcriptional regulator
MARLFCHGSGMADAIAALDDLVREVRLTFHQLRAAAEGLHGVDSGVTAAHRGVLESLYREGPRTVPELARARPVSRQHIQTLVNRLLELRLVRTVPNPAHKRSVLLELTPAGRTRFEDMKRRERDLLAEVARSIPESQSRRTTRSLRQLRDLLAARTAR